jgi:hypothetical protein
LALLLDNRDDIVFLRGRQDNGCQAGQQDYLKQHFGALTISKYVLDTFAKHF